MFTITFRDGSKVSVDRQKLLERDSCFQPLAETTGDGVRFDATGGECRSALLEYLGAGAVEAREIQRRADLRSDLEAWGVPVVAWPNDLRLRAMEEERAAALELSLAYQLTWVPGLVADCQQIVRESTHPTVFMKVSPGTARFNVAASDHDFSEVDRISERAFTAVKKDLEASLHMHVSAETRTGLVIVWLPDTPLKRKRSGPDPDCWGADAGRDLREMFRRPKLSVFDRLRRLEEHCGIQDP